MHQSTRCHIERLLVLAKISCAGACLLWCGWPRAVSWAAEPVAADSADNAERGKADALQLSFINDVLPVLTKHGCNRGGCHGRGSGQNGFKLSLFGFDPTADYAALVDEGLGRRISWTAPGESLLLAKSSGQIPHGGGVRLTPDSVAGRP